VAHEVAKLILEHAGTFVERTEAIKVAMNLGMPLDEIEEYLDWLDAIRAKAGKKERGRGDRAS
jgi:DNA-binding transcriptional MerR regulator